MSLNTAGLFNALASHAASLGIFDRVNNHEPANAPGNGLSYSLHWVRIAPVPTHSGLASTTGVVPFLGRIYRPAAQPSDEVDIEVLGATDALLAVYSADFTLGGLVRNVDLLGQTGNQLSAQAGWLLIDAIQHRTSDITIPLIVNDLWTQAP
jgi:hypothetical protein